MSHIIPVETIGGNAEFAESGFEGKTDGSLSGAGQSRKPDSASAKAAMSAHDRRSHCSTHMVVLVRDVRRPLDRLQL